MSASVVRVMTRTAVLLVAAAVGTQARSHGAVRNAETSVHYDFEQYKDQCTSIGVGPGATVDGSTMTTHNNDCQDCDFRISHVPARDWPAGSKRPVQGIRNNYPRYVESTEANIHGPLYAPEKVDRSVYDWQLTPKVGEIDQVAHTYAYTLGTYALQNEKQLSMGESTCSAVFVGVPTFAGGKALLHMETLTELAMERCDTARCAVQLMGDLGVQYGFYGPEYDSPDRNNAQDEAGEALTVADPFETWMFHIMPDDTGASAIWVAQRVPDNHVTVVANQFVIGEINVNDKENFLASSNIFEVAVRNNLWSPDSKVPFNFGYVYGTDRHRTAHACTRRVWRVFSLVAPSLKLSPYTDGLQKFGYGPNFTQPYPFSVPVDKLLTPEDVMRISRDQYEGTPFDLSKLADAGPFGDTMRYAPMSKLLDPVNGITREGYASSVGGPRPISLWRTAYSSLTQSRKSLPDLIGAVTWIAQYAPHFSTFVPVYAGVANTPSSLSTGHLYKMDKGSNWWVHCLTGNYLGRWYVHTIGDIRDFQTEQERKLSADKQSAESHALKALSRSTSTSSRRTASAAIGSGISDINTGDANLDPTSTAAKLLADFQEQSAVAVREAWWEFFFVMAGKYRDMYKIVDAHAESFNAAYKYLTVPRGFLEMVGSWGAPGTPPSDEAKALPVRPLNIPTEDSAAAYAAKYPDGPDKFFYYYPDPNAPKDTSVYSLWIVFVAAAIGAAVGALITNFFCQRSDRHAYLPIK